MAAQTDQSAFLNPDIWKTGQVQLAGGQPPAGPGSPTLPASFGGPVPPGQTPPPSVNPQVVYTANGQGYNPNELKSAWGDGSTAFAKDPANARVSDILQQYGTVLGKPMAPANAPAAAVAPGAAGAGGASAGGVAPDPRGSAFFDMLMSRLGGINENPDANDPIIKKQTDAYAANTERANRSYLTQAAERGGSSGNTDAIARSLAEKAGQATGTFSAGLMGDERTQRRSEIQNMLGMGSQFLTEQQRMALTQEMDHLNRQERAYEFDSNDAYRYSPFAAGATV